VICDDVVGEFLLFAQIAKNQIAHGLFWFKEEQRQQGQQR
jgi:hypothetical protein